MNRFYFRAGHTERPQSSRGRPSYVWRQGYSLIYRGHPTQPWVTMREARDAAKLAGVWANFYGTQEEAVAAELKHRHSGEYICYDLWCLKYWDDACNDYVHAEFGHERSSVLDRVDVVATAHDQAVRVVAVVHPAEWAARAWVAANGAPIGKPGRACVCAKHHAPPPRRSKTPEVSNLCYGDRHPLDFLRDLSKRGGKLSDLY